MNQPWKVIVVLFGIFIAGGVTGGFVGLRISRNATMDRPVPEEWAPKHIKMLIERLGLTPDQVEQIRPIVRRDMEQLNRVRNYAQSETQTVVAGMQRDITELLTPEQRTKFEQLNRETREKFEARERREREKRLQLGRTLGEKPPERPGDRPPADRPSPPK
ncbi:MAG TPA: hypothetical protein VG734_02795 [Lacunisphaera sp.]|nr:hypothetical protein [Lacunisphaera sp.]